MDSVSTKNNRRRQPKTKTGCGTCKRRKVKCGEELPACKNCIKHAVQCDFLSKPSPTFDSTSSKSNSVSLSFGTAASSNGTSGGELKPLAMSDLELLHHFSCATYSTLSCNPKMRELWFKEVPQMAFSHPFLMRNILAISALHLASLRREWRDYYICLAMNQHNDALRAATPLLADVKQEDAPALWVFSSLTLIFNVASPKNATQILRPGGDGLFQWVYLLRGVQSVMAVAKDALDDSPLRPLFTNGSERASWRKSSTSQEVHLLQLRDRIINTNHILLDVYLSVIEELQKVYALASCVATGSYRFVPGPHEMTDCFVWPFLLPDEYITELQQNSPEALVIFAHFCVLLQIWDDKSWWLHGWSDQLMSLIWSSLPQDYRPWIEWPVGETGWIPTRSRNFL